jgi:hypothetical protein
MLLTRPAARRGARTVFLSLLVLAPGGVHGQMADTASSAIPLTALQTPGSPAEDRVRLRQLFGAPAEGFLIRSPSSRTPDLPAREGRMVWDVLAPEVQAAWNDEIPFAANDGSLWAGRGTNVRVTSGVRLRRGRISLIVAPEVTYSQNLPFQTASEDAVGRTPLDRSSFASPWYVGAHSADLPLRFGDQPLLGLHPGQSTLVARFGEVVAGLSTENQWWGPGVRNAIVMSNQAPGIPHAFVRTAAPLRTPLGRLEGKWILGGLAESLYFDTVSTNDVRSLSGFAATFQPRGEPNLTLGLSRVVYAPVNGAGEVPGHLLDVFTRWNRGAGERPDSTLPAPVRTLARGPDHEQLLSLFGRWIFPREGLELYGEWARVALPTSLVDLANQPNHTQGYTLGLQWARPAFADHLFRLQTELTYLEESATYNNRPTPLYYVSRSVVQGYTHRGQGVGAVAGPGGSSQWLAGDYVAPGWRVGAFGGRNRWNNDVYYDKPERIYIAHDVSVLGGVRAGFRLRRLEAGVEVQWERRYNYLFQNPEVEPEGDEAEDVWNRSLRLVLSPAWLSR